MAFLQELKRRRVARVAIVYGAVAFGVLQAADVLVPALQLPASLMTGVTVLAILGLPVALGLAWAFDVGPSGVHRTPDSPPGDQATQASESAWVGRGTIVAAAVPLLVGFGLGAGWFLRPIASGAPAGEEISVAALPFESLSPSEDDRYFTDGIHDEILTQLSKIGALRVISRTSVMQYRSAERNVAEIARALGARYVLEGSVRRGTDRVRITAQLIDARADSHVWAETYDRSPEDVLGVQSEVATRIAEALHAALTPEERRRLDEPQAVDQVTYDLFLRARGLGAEYSGRANNERSMELYRQAIERDAGFAPAKAGLAEGYAIRVLAHGFPQEWADTGLAAADRALQLDPELADAHAARMLNLILLGRLREARAAGERAMELSPSHADAVRWLSWMERELGRFDVAVRLSETSIRLDPTSADGVHSLAASYRALRAYDRAEELSTRVLEIQPNNPWAHSNFVYMDLERGRYESARRWAEALLELEPDDLTGHFLAGDVEAWAGRWETSREIYQRLYDLAPDVRLAGVWWSARSGLGSALHELGRTEEAEPLLERALADARARIDRGEEHPTNHIEISMVYAIRGEREAALEWLERAYEAGWRYGFLATLPHFVLLRDDPDFQRITTRIDEDIAAMRASLELSLGPRAATPREPGPEGS